MELNTEGQCDSDVSDSWSVVDFLGENISELTGMTKDKDKDAFQVVDNEHIDECFELTEMTVLDRVKLPLPEELPKISPAPPESHDTAGDSDGISIISETEDEEFVCWKQVAHKNYEEINLSDSSFSVSPCFSVPKLDDTAQPEIGTMLDEGTAELESDITRDQDSAQSNDHTVPDTNTEPANRIEVTVQPEKIDESSVPVNYQREEENDGDNDTYSEDSDREDTVAEPSLLSRLVSSIECESCEKDDPQPTTRHPVHIPWHETYGNIMWKLIFPTALVATFTCLALTPFLRIYESRQYTHSLEVENEHVKSKLSEILSDNNLNTKRSFRVDLSNDFPCRIKPASTSTYLQSRKGLLACLQEITDATSADIFQYTTKMKRNIRKVPTSLQPGLQKSEKKIAKEVQNLLLQALEGAELIALRMQRMSLRLEHAFSPGSEEGVKLFQWYPENLGDIPGEPNQSRGSRPPDPTTEDPPLVDSPHTKPETLETAHEKQGNHKDPVPDNRLKFDNAMNEKSDNPKEPELDGLPFVDTPQTKRETLETVVHEKPELGERLQFDNAQTENLVHKKQKRLKEVNSSENIVESQEQVVEPLPPHKKNKRQKRKKRKNRPLDAQEPVPQFEEKGSSKNEKNDEPKHKRSKVKFDPEESKSRSKESQKENLRKECPKRVKGNIAAEDKCSNGTGEWYLKRGKFRESLRDVDDRDMWYVNRMWKSRNM